MKILDYSTSFCIMEKISEDSFDPFTLLKE
jgi:hypothetical protein